MQSFDFRIKSLLAATDLSESSVAALRYARMLAERFRAKLTVIYSDPLGYPIEVIGAGASMFLASTPEHMARLRAEVEQHVEPVLAGLPYDVQISIGPPSEMIVRTANQRNVDVIVMGTHGHRGWRRAVLGSVAENVLHTASCPVLTVNRHSALPAQGPVTFTRILCPTNFSDVARDSMGIARTLADAFNAELHVVHVVEEGHETPPLQEPMGTYHEIVLRGGAAERILDYAEDLGADLLVIGAQRQLFRDATVIGTTTERLVRFASCPVLAVTREAKETTRAPEAELVTAG